MVFMSKKSTGVVLDKHIIDFLDDIKDKCVDLGVTRSEVINAILNMYNSSKSTKLEKLEKVRGSIIKIRKGKILR